MTARKAKPAAEGKPEAPAQDPRRRAFRIRAGSLKAALADVAGLIVPKSTIPILANVLLDVADGALRVCATNLDMWAARELATDDREANSGEWRAAIRGFATTVPGKSLLAVVSGFDADAMVTIELIDNRLQVSAGRSRFRLPVLPPDDLPLFAPRDWPHAFTMRASALDDVLAAVSHAISTEETRYYLGGVYLHAEGLGLRAAATDGARLARIAFDAPEGACSFPSVIIARQTVSVLAKLLGRAGDDAEVEIAASDGGKMLRFDLPCPDDGRITIEAKTVDGTFPDYTRVIPAAPKLSMTADRAMLLGALGRVAVLAEGKSRAVKLEAEDDRLTLSASSPELGEACEDLPVVFGGPPISWGFDARYLREALEAMASDEVRLMLDDAGAPVRIEAAGADEPALVQVVMPLRV
jgi:DNA polymerase-3 subunit beta